MSFTRTLRAVGGAVVAGALLFGIAPVASADQIRHDQWPLRSFGADDIWKVSTGKGVTVAVIDDPVDGSHPDLKGSVLPGKSLLAGGGPADRAYEKFEHGTAMASLIAGHGHGPAGSQGVKGLAPDAKILPVGIDLGKGRAGTDSYAEPLRYAVDHGAKVVNMSFEVYSDTSPAEKAAVDYARKHDVLVVAASGNSGSSTPRLPAAVPGVLAVGAVDIDLKVWKYSNYGPHIKLLAPGLHIRSAGVETPYRLANGTSDATAYVSAAAALLRSKFPDLTAGQIANRLVKTAGLPDDMKGKKLPDPHYGYGFIKPWMALTADIPPGSRNGPLPAFSDSSSKSPGKDNGAEPAAQSDSDKGMSTGVLIGIVGGVVGLLVVILVVVLVAKKKNRRNGPPAGGPGGLGGYCGPGGPEFVPQQPGPYQQPGAVQQQPGVPAFPPSSPTQPPGR